MAVSHSALLPWANNLLCAGKWRHHPSARDFFSSKIRFQFFPHWSSLMLRDQDTMWSWKGFWKESAIGRSAKNQYSQSLVNLNQFSLSSGTAKCTQEASNSPWWWIKHEAWVRHSSETFIYTHPDSSYRKSMCFPLPGRVCDATQHEKRFPTIEALPSHWITVTRKRSSPIFSTT